jgi:hypothetical protein
MPVMPMAAARRLRLNAGALLARVETEVCAEACIIILIISLLKKHPENNWNL